MVARGGTPSGFDYRYLPSKGTGIYKLVATDKGRTSEACIRTVGPGLHWIDKKPDQQ